MLKVRTGYSFRAAAGKIDKVLDRLQELGHTSAPITDRASTFGFHRWKKACEARGMKPVFGVELAVTASINAKKPSVDYWTFIAQDSVEPINRLVTLATTQFRYQPLLTLEQALAAEGVFKMTGHRPPMELWELEPQDGVAVGLMPSTPVAVVKRALARGWQFAASSDNRYPTINDKGFYEVLTGRNAETQTYPQHILSQDEWKASVAHHGIDNATLEHAKWLSDEWLQKSFATLQKSSLPHFAAEQTLLQLCEAGAERLGCDLNRPEYSDRLRRELSLIEVKQYEDYFYIVSDLCLWARERMIVGPARGSSCGSLVCYLLGITTVDPIPFGLIFERFISINRGGWKFPKEIESEGLFSERTKIAEMVSSHIESEKGPQNGGGDSQEDERDTQKKISKRRVAAPNEGALSPNQRGSGKGAKGTQRASQSCEGSRGVTDDSFQSEAEIPTGS